MFNRELGCRIKKLRGKHHYTQEMLAEKADISSQHIQRLEGKTPGKCFVTTIRSIAKAFGMTLCQFFEEM
jgi:DNA-binding XRE family transcriptional regulator